MVYLCNLVFLQERSLSDPERYFGKSFGVLVCLINPILKTFLFKIFLVSFLGISATREQSLKSIPSISFSLK